MALTKLQVYRMTIDKKEAEFIAVLFDATIKRVEWQMRNLDAFKESQRVVGVEITEPDNVIIDHFENAVHDMLCIRERIRNNFDL